MSVIVIVHTALSIFFHHSNATIVLGRIEIVGGT